jgi:hypothetical protein
MSDGTPGVLLKGEDGSHYFIPHTDLSRFSVGDVGDAGDQVAQAAPRIDAFSVRRGGGEVDVAFFPMPESP